MQQLSKSINDAGSAATSVGGVISGAFNSIKSSGIAASVAAGALNAALSVGLTVAISAAVSGIMALGDKIKTAATYDQDKIDKANETKTKYKDSVQQKSADLTTLKTNQAEFNSLANGVDEYGNNISLDTSSYQRFLELRQQIVDITPSIVESYDAEGNAIVRTTDLMKNAIEAQERDLANTQKKQANGDTLKTILDGAVEQYKKDGNSWWDSFKGEDYDNAKSGIQDILSRRSSLSSAYSEAAKKVVGEELDLSNQKDLKTFVNNYSKIMDEVEKSSTFVSDQEKSDLQENVNLIKENYEAVKSLKAEMGEYFATIPAGVDGYNKLSSAQQGFLNNIAKNRVNDLDLVGKSPDEIKEILTNTFDDVTSDIEKIIGNEKFQDQFDKLFDLNTNKSGLKAKKWSDSMKSTLQDLEKTTGLTVKEIAKALNIDIDKDGNILHGGKNVTQMLSALEKQFKGTKGLDEYLNSLNFDQLTQAFTIATSKTEIFTGSLDQLKKRMELLNKPTQSTWSDYLTAETTADANSTYLAMREAFNNQKKQRDKGLVGTDDFKTLTSVLSASGKDDIETFDKTWKKTTKYFTEDDSGLMKFLDDLSEKSKEAGNDFGTLSKHIDKEGRTVWDKIDIKDNKAAAKALGMGIEPFEAIMNALRSYDFDINMESITAQYDTVGNKINELASEWQKLEGGAGKTIIGEEIEEYRQQLLKAQQAGEEIPDDLIKKLTFEISVIEKKSDFIDSVSSYQDALRGGDKKKQKKYLDELDYAGDAYLTSALDEIEKQAKSSGYKLDSNWRDEQVKEYQSYINDLKNPDIKVNKKQDISNNLKKYLNDTVEGYAEALANGTADFATKVTKKSLNKKLKEIDKNVEVDKNNTVQLTGDKKKDDSIKKTVKEYNEYNGDKNPDIKIEEHKTNSQDLMSLFNKYLNQRDKRESSGPNMFGNVDLNKRPIVLDKPDKNGNASYKTVYGSSQEIGNGKLKGQEIMFTPILGTTGEELDDKTINKYISEITKNATSEEDVLKLDSEGMMIDGKKIQDIIFGIAGSSEEATAIMKKNHAEQEAAYSDEAQTLQNLKSKMEEAGLSTEGLDTSFDFEAVFDIDDSELEKLDKTKAELEEGSEFKVIAKADLTEAQQEILDWAGIEVEKNGKLKGDITDAQAAVLAWMGIRVSKDGYLMGNTSDADAAIAAWLGLPVSKTGNLKANTASATQTVQNWASSPITRYATIAVSAVTGIGSAISGALAAFGFGRANGTAHVGGSAYAHGAIPTLSGRAYAMGSLKVNNRSEISPIIRKQSGEYVQDKSTKFKNAVSTKAHASGDWGLKQNERALTGELGQELVVCSSMPLSHGNM